MSKGKADIARVAAGGVGLSALLHLAAFAAVVWWPGTNGRLPLEITALPISLAFEDPPEAAPAPVPVPEPPPLVAPQAMLPPPAAEPPPASRPPPSPAPRPTRRAIAPAPAPPVAPAADPLVEGTGSDTPQAETTQSAALGGPAIAAPVAGASAPARTAVAPRPIHAPAPSYPDNARRRGLEGRVIIRLDLDAEGQASNFRLATSSGHELLDQAALKGLKRWRFAAPGTPLEDIEIPVVFRLRD
ncbi:MAG: energy transducer TonB [Alphaproteobacteria bacterium]|nr:energy transducer TonB [Alphaproteobacteria bacterium]